MRALTDPVESLVREGWTRTQRAVESGLSYVTSSWPGLPFFASVEAEVQQGGSDHDETHYFLVPYRRAESGYALYSVRRVPSGFAQASDLPRRRVFHLPGERAERAVERLILSERLAREEEAISAVGIAAGGPSVGSRLERLADEIDRKSNLVTGGVLLVGGLVAITHPLLGAGIAVKAIYPSIGALLSREGLKLSGSRLRAWQQRRRASKLAKRRRARARELEQEMVDEPVVSLVNPMLEMLEQALSTTAAELEPLLEFEYARFSELEAGQVTVQHELLVMSARAVLAVYDHQLSKSEPDEGTRLGPEDVRWLESLRALV